MGKPILIALAAIVGILGLAMTACGTFFATAGGGTNAAIAFLIGIVPGVLFMWLAYRLFKRVPAQSKPAQSSEQPPPGAG